VVTVAALGFAALLGTATLWPSAPWTSRSPSPSAVASLPIASPGAAPTTTGAAATPNSAGLPNASPGAAPTAANPQPSPSAVGPLGGLDLPAVAPTATLVATDIDRSGVATDAAFTLTSLGATGAAELARAIVVTPAIELAVEADANAATATLRPTGPLVPGRLYRFTLHAPDGSISGSWAFQAQSPLRVVTTLPYHGSTDVPVATGIELTFDRDGTIDAAPHFSIVLAVKGRFEQHGRTFVFVPERLEPATLYTVTLGRGVRLEDSSQALEQDVVVQFETALPAGTTQPSVSYDFRPTMEWRPGDPPIVAIGISTSAPTAAEQLALRKRPFPVTVYRLPSERAGTDAIRTLTETPDWTIWSRPTVSTEGLPRVLSFDALPQSDTDWGGSWFRFPASLERGWYLVEGPRPQGGGQMVLQVTDVAAYVAAGKDRLLVWANDTTTGGPIEGATVEMSGGAVIGSTGPDGLLVATTPSSIRDATDPVKPGNRPFLAVRASGGRSLLIQVGLSGQGRAYSDEIQDRFWRFMATDRQTYRQTDTVNIWGFLRERDTGRVPQDVELRLMSDWGYGGGR